MTTWDPAQYLQFSDHRLRPALDLIGRIDHPGPTTIWDLGCGAGAPTNSLVQRWPSATVTGLDSSPEMLKRAAEFDGIDWIHGDIATWEPDKPVDIIYTNAALQWLDDHETLFPRLVSYLAPGGVIAVQMPRNHGEPSHQRLYETARSERWAQQTEHLVRETPVGTPDFYHSMLRSRTSRLDIWETIYQQDLTGSDAVANWAKGSVVKTFLDALDDDADDFFADYSSRLVDDYPSGADGTTLFSFRRVFIVATV